MKIKSLAIASMIAASLALGACGSDSPEITNAWTRVTAPSQTSGAVYMDIESPDGDRLTKASVPQSVAARVELHQTVMAGESGSTGESGSMGETGSDSMEMEDHGSMDSDEKKGSTGDTGDSMSGKMTMKPVDGIDLPAGKTVQLKPGGYHIMLLDLAEQITPGQEIEVTLTFEKAGTRTISAVAKES